MERQVQVVEKKTGEVYIKPSNKNLLKEADIGTNVLAPNGDGSQLQNLPVPNFNEVGCYVVAFVLVSGYQTYTEGNTFSGSALVRYNQPISVLGAAIKGADKALSINLSGNTESIGATGTWRLMTRIYNNDNDHYLPGLFVKIL